MADREGKSAAPLLIAGVFDIVLGTAFLLWGERVEPLAATIPGLFGLSLAKICGLALLFLAAPAAFIFYFLRRRQDAAKAAVPRGPVTRL